MSPYADLTLAGTTTETGGETDPLLGRDRLQPRVADDAAAALDRGGQLLSGHLAGAERVTA
jgi:hypothetical protein